jgi:sugar O-acyltransferase (sialic acid O-acetyltransferase NeuD family)
VGGGGHCKSVLDTLLPLKQFVKIGIIEREIGNANSVLGIPVVGVDDDLAILYNNEYRFAFITMGSVGNPKHRIKLYGLIKAIGYQVPNIIDLTASVSEHTAFGAGVFVGKRAIVNAGSTIANGSILNSGCLIEHDCVVGEFSHIAPGAVLCGNAQIGEHTHIGAGSVVKQGVRVGKDVIIGAGAVVIRDIPDSCTAVGVPANPK